MPRLFRARDFADEIYTLAINIFCPIEAMLPQKLICYYRFIVRNFGNHLGSSLNFLLPNQGPLTVLRAVFRSKIGPVVLEELVFKKSRF